MSKYSKKVLASKVNSVRPYKSRTKRPCDFCRRRKTCCIIEELTPCLACALFNKGVCTFLEEPVKRKKTDRSDEKEKETQWVRDMRRQSEPHKERDTDSEERRHSYSPTPQSLSYPQAKPHDYFDYYRQYMLPEQRPEVAEEAEAPDTEEAAGAEHDYTNASYSYQHSDTDSQSQNRSSLHSLSHTLTNHPENGSHLHYSEYFPEHTDFPGHGYSFQYPGARNEESLDSSSERSRLMSMASLSTFQTLRNPSIILPLSGCLAPGYFEPKETPTQTSPLRLPSQNFQNHPHIAQNPQIPMSYSQNQNHVAAAPLMSYPLYDSEYVSEYAQGYEYA